MIIACLPIGLTLFSVLTGGLPRLDGASLLVLWGLVIVATEHAGFGNGGFRRSSLMSHEGFHHQMLAAYGLAALVVTGVVIAPLIRRGDKNAWYRLLALSSVGLTEEVAAAIVTTPHGIPRRWWSWGLVLWVYPIACTAALALSWRHTFGGQRSTTVP